MRDWIRRFTTRCLQAEPTQMAAWFRIYYFANKPGIDPAAHPRLQELLGQPTMNRAQLSEMIGILMSAVSAHALVGWRETLRYEYSLLLNRPASAETPECRTTLEELRNEVAMLVAQVARLRSTRRSLSIMRNAICSAGLLVAIIYLIIGVSVSQITKPLNDDAWVSVLYPIMIMGGLGGLTSGLSRLYSIQWRGPALLMYTHVASLFWGLMLNLVLASFQGITFAIVLYAIFTTEFLQGALFPKIDWTYPDSGAWLDYVQHGGPVTPVDVGKTIIWAFVAGFSERFVPDLMRQLSAQAREAGPVRTTGPADAASAPPTQLPASGLSA